MTRGFHEDFSRRDAVEGGSERGFGLVFAVVFTVVGLWPLRRIARQGGHP